MERKVKEKIENHKILRKTDNDKIFGKMWEWKNLRNFWEFSYFLPPRRLFCSGPRTRDDKAFWKLSSLKIPFSSTTKWRPSPPDGNI